MKKNKDALIDALMQLPSEHLNRLLDANLIKERVEIIDSEIAVFFRSPVDDQTVIECIPEARFEIKDGSIRLPLSFAINVKATLPSRFIFSEEFKRLLIKLQA